MDGSAAGRGRRRFAVAAVAVVAVVAVLATVVVAAPAGADAPRTTIAIDRMHPFGELPADGTVNLDVASGSAVIITLDGHA
jgi:hypothetical protein